MCEVQPWIQLQWHGPGDKKKKEKKEPMVFQLGACKELKAEGSAPFGVLEVSSFRLVVGGRDAVHLGFPRFRSFVRS